MRTDIFAKACIAAAALAAQFAPAQGLRYEPPQIEGYEYPFPSSYGSPLSVSNPAILKKSGKLFSDTAAIDFEGRRLTFLRVDSLGRSIWTYHYGELSDYITDSRNHSFYENWYNGLSARERNDLGMPAPPKLQWELAVHYPPWAQRLLGNDPPRLRIEGRLQLTAAFDYVSTRIGEEEPIVDIVPFEFDPQYEFSIHGSVGRLISVNIKHSKQDGFELGEDPLKNFKVEYKESEPGELEDEIIQEIVAGYTGFDMPGTSLSGYSDKHEGLFGIKVRAKVGPLMLTGIASHAQGEAMTREFGGKNDPNSASSIREDEFAKNTYFFLDNRYKAYYNELNNIRNPNRNPANRPPAVTRFQAFVSVRCEETTQSTTRRYKAMVDGSEVCFKMLTENQDYIYDADRGWVRFEYHTSDDDIIAIAMETRDGSLNRGSIVPLSTPNDERVSLWTLKPRGMEQATAFGNDSLAMRFGLMWRNVYYLPEIEDGKLDLFFLDPAKGDTIRHTGNSRLFSEVMGLTDAQGRARLEMVDIFNIDRQELIIPPYDAGLNGNEPLRNPLLGKYSVDSMGVKDTSIYTVGSRHTWMINRYVSQFGILTNGSVRRTSYDLGWNILPGTVTIKTKSGTLLVEDEDYYLDYQMGSLELISTRARAAESILATYQRESDFVLERKVFAGLRGEVKLPFISDNSFAAVGILYQNAATSAGDIPQLGNEPFSKLHLSFNTSLDFEPEWMTSLVNKIPLVKTEEESAAKVGFEIVHSRMNQNTSKEKAAYLDDFERTKDGYSLSLRHQSWYPSHFPFDISYDGGGNDYDAALRRIDEMMRREHTPAWDFYWFTPNAYDDRNMINRYSVWTRDPHNASYSGSDTYIDVLRLHATPAHPDRALQGRFKNPYAAITSSFGRSGLNMENHRYIELVVNPAAVPGASARKGKLMVQIGTFSHDQIRDGGPPNGRFDLEDPTYQNKPELLSTYDKGLNGLDVANKFYLIPNEAGDGWDTLWRNDPRLVSPRGPDNPNGDLFRRYDRDNTGNFRWANGTRGNSIYDTENIDFDGIPRVQIQEKYVSYTIDLDNASEAYIDKNARLQNGWRFYRIPLLDPLIDASVKRGTVGELDWAKVRGVRLVWYDFDPSAVTSENQLYIAGLEMVGSTWEPSPGSQKKVEPTMISNEDNEVYYNSVYNGIVKPKSGEATPREGALRLVFSNVGQRDTAIVRKSMKYYPQNISGYDSLSIMVNNVNMVNGEEFVLRFGSDDSTYYEYRAPLRAPGARGSTGSWERFVFSLQKFSDLKLDADFSDTAAIDAVGGRLRVAAPPGKRPNFTAVTFLAVGVATGARSGTSGGELWVNELMATGPRALTGVAARIDLSTQWADFLSLGAGASYTDGSFRTMTENLLGTDDRSELSANVSGKVRADKFMPEEWGVSIPVGGSLSGALSRPTVKPQSDIMLLKDDGKPDGLFDMAGDALDMMLGRGGGGDTTRAEHFQTFTSTRNAYTSFEKTSESENPFIGFTLDRIKTDVSYNRTTGYTAKGPHEDPDSADYFRSDTVTTYASNLYYDLSPRNPPEWTSASPFSDVEWMPGIYQKYKLNLLPSSIEFDLFEATHRTEVRNDAKLNVHDFRTRTFDMRHGMRVDYTPVDPLLNFGYGIRWDRDLSDREMTRDWDIMVDSTFPKIFGLNRSYGQKWDEYGVLYGERGRTQSAAMRLTPQFVNWMTHSAEYTADYQGQFVRRDTSGTQYINAIVNTSLRLRSSLLLVDLFKELSKGSKDGFFGVMGEGVTAIGMRSVGFEYDVNTSLKNNYLSSTFLIDTAGLSGYEYFKYQLGLRRDGLSDYFWGRLGHDGLGYMLYRRRLVEEDFELWRYDQSMGSWGARFSTAFTIPAPIKINFSTVSVGWGREFYAQPDTLYIDTTVVLPDIRTSANTDALEKIPFIQAHMSKLGLNTSFGFKRSRKETWDRTDTTTAVDLQPLVGLEGKFRNWPTLTANYRFGMSNTYIVSGGKENGESVGVLSTEENRRNSHTLTAAYEFSGAGSLQEIKLRKWVIPVSGKTTVGFAVNWETTVRVYTITDEEPKEAEDSEFNYSPYIEYKFTDNISGQARYLGSHRNSSGARTMQQRFALTVEVVF